MVRFPYANSSPKDFFDRRLGFVYGAGKLGLTCSSYILALFNSVGIDLVDYGDWPIRPGDDKWMEYCINRMEMPPEHAQMIRDEGTKIPRYKPLEVAGSAAIANYPVKFRTAKRYARRIRVEILDRRKLARH
jgi:hypothetical protein